jgi:DHA1 family multidrug resistance protein-like MFS transporter
MRVAPPHVKVSPLLRRPAVVRLLLITLLAEIGYAVLNVSGMPVYLRYDRLFGESVISMVLGAYLLSDALFRGTMGHLADKIGRRRLMVIGPAITIFTPLLTIAVPHDGGYAESITIILLRVCDGIGTAMLWPAAYALVSDTVAEEERHEAMSLLNGCFLLGIALAMPIGGAANYYLGAYFSTGARSPSLYLATFLFIAVAVAAYFYVPSGKEQRERAQEMKNGAGASADGSDIAQFFASFRRIPQLLILGFVTFVGVGFPMAMIKLFAEDEFRMNETEFGALVFPAAIAMALLSVPLSKIGERIGKVRAVHFGMALCVVGLIPICLGAFFEAFRSAWAIVLGGIPLGLGFLVTIPAWYANITESEDGCRGANIGAVMTAQGVGAIIGALLGGAAYEQLKPIYPHLGRYSPFLGSLLCVTIAWLVGLRILREPPAQPAADPNG